MFFRKGIFVFIIVSFISGCVGIEFYPASTEQRTVVNPMAINKWDDCHLKSNDLPVIRSEFIKVKGEPESIETDGPNEYLFYQKELIWAGVLAYITVLPIPLMLPVNTEYCKFTVTNGKVVEGVRYKQKEKWAGQCGWVFTGGPGYKTKIGCVSS